MIQKCKKCGSHAFNLHWDGIDQADLCDRHYWQDRAENPQMQWTKERPTQAGVYWINMHDETSAITCGHVVGKLMFDIPGYSVQSVDSGFFNGAYWLGPIEVPAPPIATPQT